MYISVSFYYSIKIELSSHICRLEVSICHILVTILFYIDNSLYLWFKRIYWKAIGKKGWALYKSIYSVSIPFTMDQSLYTSLWINLYTFIMDQSLYSSIDYPLYYGKLSRWTSVYTLHIRPVCIYSTLEHSTYSP